MWLFGAALPFFTGNPLCMFYSGYILAAFALFIYIPLNAQSGKEITGYWKAKNEDKSILVQIYTGKDGLYYGVTTEAPAKPPKQILKELKYYPDKNYYKGLMLPPEAGITLNVTVYPEEQNRLKLIVSKFLVSKTMYFERVE